ncbi:glycosyltransferase family 4 protein [Ramlibacter sp. RBP-2]|uniref:Glycosyltransferase family 4 protein n=1 Tax=Ramlibacter lithotrophicus TaxID=2606681 RepID=A0A7X6DKA1_9BURK|nr:glycosyltransferase [Ramlibacter lithotrophicus]NKE68722.1 glycosyltransferase family 4 protein [Ramlibacter lithotrophicus]
MKLLILTYSYSPDLNPRAFRWSSVAAQLARNGHEVHVLCASRGEQQEREHGVVIHRVRDWLIATSAQPVSTMPSKGSAPAPAAWQARLRSLARSLWRALRWPDYACGWIIPAVRAGRSLCSSHRYDWIISVSHPFTGHLVGALLRPAAPQASWMVDIGDPFHLMQEPSPNNRRLYGWLSRRVEAHVVATADAISVTTPSTQGVYESFFSPPHGKVRVVPPLLSLPTPPPPSPHAGDGVVRIVFVGTLYRKLRSPRFLLECFSALRAALPQDRLEMHFYGSVNDCAEDLAAYQEAAQGALFVHGLVDRAEVLQAMVDATVLVNIGNESETQLASKVIEYMAVGKPILNLVSSSRDTSLAALAQYPAVLHVYRTVGLPVQETVDTIRAFVLAKPVVPGEAVEAELARYSISYVCACYEAMLRRRADAGLNCG